MMFMFAEHAVIVTDVGTLDSSQATNESLHSVKCTQLEQLFMYTQCWNKCSVYDIKTSGTTLLSD